MLCPICGLEEWKDLDYLRDKKFWYELDMIFDEKIGFAICQHCGFITYQTTPDMVTRYSKQRSNVSFGHYATGQFKNILHRAFFKNEWKIGRDILDIGCGVGTLLDMFRTRYGATGIYGTEYAEKLRNYAEGRYGITVGKEPEEFNRQFDFIVLYHTLEHMLEPEKMLKRAKALLRDGGMMYISVPEWMHKIINVSGGSVADSFEDYFHLNHVNCFTRASFYNLLKVCGLKVIKEDFDLLGMTVLCTACEPSQDIKIEDSGALVKRIEKFKEAFSRFGKRKFAEAFDVVPEYPDAYIHRACMPDSCKDFKAVSELYERALKAMPGDLIIMRQYAGTLKQWDGSKGEPELTNNIRKSLAMFNAILARRPEGFVWENLVDLHVRFTKDYKKALEYIRDWKDHDFRAVESSFGLEAHIYQNRLDRGTPQVP